MRKLAALGAGLALGLACGRPAPPPPAVLVIGTAQDLGTLHPVTAQTTVDAAVLGAVQLPMLDGQFDCGMRYGPGAYASMVEDADGQGLVATLTPGLTWADGHPVTAADVVLTYALARDADVASPRAGHVAHLEPESPTALDDHTVHFRFTHAYDPSTQRSHAGLLATPAHVFATADRASLRGHPRSTNPLSNGPFHIAVHEPGVRFVLEPNPAYSGPEAFRPHLDRVVFQVIPEYTTRLAMLKAGELDLIEGVTLEDADALAVDAPQVRVVSRGYRFVEFIAWNLSDPRFASLAVRRALAQAVDTEALIRHMLTAKDGTRHARRAVGTITPELCQAHADDVVPLPYDPAAAAAALEAEGWVDRDGDGWRDKDGQPFRFVLVTTAGNPRRAEVALVVQSALAKLGIDVQLEQRDVHAFYDSLRKRDFEAALGGWSASLFLDPTEMWQSDAVAGPRSFNITGYQNPVVDALIAQGLRTRDPAEAATAWRALQAAVYADQPYLFLWWTDDLVAVHKRFTHTDIGPLSALGHLEAWRVQPVADPP